MTLDMPPDVAEILNQCAREVEDYLRKLPRLYPSAPARLVESISYSLMAGGKRMRPALVLQCARACGNNKLSDTAHKSALTAAAAMELIHTFSLVHDDLPAMDDDDLRRGRPTNHKVFGEAMAILAGDAMTTLAFEILANEAAPPVAASLIRELAHASGPEGMIGGQVIDMDEKHRPQSVDDLKRLHRMKTGALLTASCRMGAIAAGADAAKLTALDAYGRHLGLAFQIVDDILDQTATAAQLGKATGKDAAKGKITYPMLMGLDNSRKEAQAQLEMGLEAITILGAAGSELKALALFVVHR